jgi:hypothetical protein
MAAVGDIMERTERKAYVRFEIAVIEDKPASLAAGRFVGRDVEIALTTPSYSKDVVRQKVTTWIQQMEENVRNDRLPRQWQKEYLEDLETWRKGQEIPLHGSPIRGWGVISPAQQENLTRMNILTVEDLAGVNDEGAKRIGMGALDLKNKAVAWLAQLKDKGPLTIEVAALKSENATLKTSLASLEAQVKALTAAVTSTASQPQGTATVKAASSKVKIAANDILPDGEAEERPLG